MSVRILASTHTTVAKSGFQLPSSEFRQLQNPNLVRSVTIFLDPATHLQTLVPFVETEVASLSFFQRSQASRPPIASKILQTMSNHPSWSKWTNARLSNQHCPVAHPSLVPAPANVPASRVEQALKNPCPVCGDGVHHATPGNFHLRVEAEPKKHAGIR